MPLTNKPEYPPLICPSTGRPCVEGMLTRDVWHMCVSKFPLSESRLDIMCGLADLIDILDESRIEGNLWLDGSFLTEKIDPDDVDIVLALKSDFVYGCTANQAAVLQWFVDEDLKPEFRCHSFLFIEFPQGHEFYVHGETERGKWLDWFGHSRKPARVPKGIVSVALPSNRGWELMKASRNRHCNEHPMPLMAGRMAKGWGR